jgi:hypothetical protein
MYQDRRGYWYRSIRRGGRVTREYMGSGAWQAVAAQLEYLDRLHAADEKRHCTAEREDFAAFDERINAASRLVEAAMHGALEAAGYHRHARGHWRKRRTPKPSQEENTMTSKIAKKTAPEKDAPTDAHALNHSLIKRAHDGDAAAAREVFALSAGVPEAAALMDKLVESIADAGLRAQAELVKKIGATPLHAEAFARKLPAMRAELCGATPTPLERMLVERIINCWLRVHTIEMLLCQQDNSSGVDFFEKQLDRAHKRHLAAIKALAQVRKLQLPTLQVNIGEKQVNIAQMNGAP